MDNSETPAIPLSSENVPWTEFRHGGNFHIRYRHLSAANGPQPYKIGVAIEELMPGKQNNPAHWHLREEEHLLILSGSLTVRIGRERHVMTEGDYVRFPAGAPHEHCLFNHTGEVCRYLIIGDRDPNDVCVYPDSNKVGVTGLGQRFMREHQDYWVGEGELTGPDPGKAR
jgi:uncharacterized cupin superfamily protein